MKFAMFENNKTRNGQLEIFHNWFGELATTVVVKLPREMPLCRVGGCLRLNHLCSYETLNPVLLDYKNTGNKSDVCECKISKKNDRHLIVQLIGYVYFCYYLDNANVIIGTAIVSLKCNG